MILEVKKINNQFVIKNPLLSMEDAFFLQIEKKNILKHRPARKMKTKTEKIPVELKALALKFPDDEFLQNKVKYYVAYSKPEEKTDSEVYHDYLNEEYGQYAIGHIHSNN